MYTREHAFILELCEKIQEKLALEYEEALVFVERAVMDKVEHLSQDVDELQELDFDEKPRFQVW